MSENRSGIRTRLNGSCKCNRKRKYYFRDWNDLQNQLQVIYEGKAMWEILSRRSMLSFERTLEKEDLRGDSIENGD